MTSHSEEGAMGFVVNRPGTIGVSDLMEQLEIPWLGGADMKIWHGGPVMPQSGWVLFDPGPVGDGGAGAMEVLPGLFLSQSAGTLRRLAARPPKQFRLLLGYSGWGPGQLERELSQGSWLVVPAERALIFETEPKEIWNACFKALGIRPDQVIPGEGIQ
jgi:putative transcriptional regulator